MTPKKEHLRVAAGRSVILWTCWKPGALPPRPLPPTDGLSETTFAVQKPAGSGQHQAVPLHDKHVFDMHVLPAPRRHRQNEP